MNDPALGAAISILLDRRRAADPDEHTPVYDLDEALHHTGYCLVRTDWLDRLYGDAALSGLREGPMDHIHLDGGEL